MTSQIQAPFFMHIGEPSYYPYNHLSPNMSSSQYVPSIYASSSSMAKSPAPAPAAPTKQIHRNRASYSCHCCRRRKVKCDQVHPTCGNCKKHGDLCQYNDNSNVKSKKKDGVKKSSSSPLSSISMSSGRSRQSIYDSASPSLLASPTFSDFPSVTPISSTSYASSPSAYLQPGTPGASYPSPQAYSPGSYYSDYSATSPSQSSAYYDYAAYSTSAYTSSIPAAVDPLYPPSTSYDEPSSYAYSSPDTPYSFYPATSGL